MTGHWTDWRDRAACLDEDPELFFPIGSGPHAALQVIEAKAVCARCPVVRRCAEFATTHGYEGVWGGLDETERRHRRRAQGATIGGVEHRPSDRRDLTRIEKGIS